MADDNAQMEFPLPEEWITHSDPAVESIRQTIYRKAAYYRLAVSVLTGKFDTSFTEWLANPVGVEMGEVENIPESEDIVEWMHLDASLASLLEYKKVLANLQTQLHLAIFGKYASKNVRGKVEHKLEDLKGLREELINVLNGTLTMAKSVPMLSAIDVDMLCDIPEVGKQKPFGDSFVWNFPDAPNPEKSNAVKHSNVAGQNLRAHNTTVKIVRDGKMAEEDANLKLGELCAKYFDKSTQDVGKMFLGWAAEYFTDDGSRPGEDGKILVRKGFDDGIDHEYWLTTVGK